MKQGRARRGTTLIEIMAAVFVLALTVIAAGALFPLSATMRDRSGYFSRASTVVQRKLEQVRKLEVQEITTSNLQTLGIVDSNVAYVSGGTGFYYFTTVDKLADNFPQSAGYLIFTGMGSDLVRADIYLSWVSYTGKRYWQKATTLIADKTVWREP